MRNREHALDFDRYSRTKGWRLSRKIFRRYLIGRYGDFLCDGGKISDDSAIPDRAKREKTRERERERFKAFRGMTRKSYYRKRILPFVFGEWFAPLFRIFIGCDRSFLWKFLNFYRIDTEFLFLYI